MDQSASNIRDNLSGAAHLRLGHSLRALRPTLHNGPGWRISLWTQGCSLRCTARCLNPEFLTHDRGFLFPLRAIQDAVIEALQSCAVSVEGITVLGGEPTDQAEAVAGLLEWARAQNLNTMLYTGHIFKDLQKASGAIARLLACTDILIDGPYREELFRDDLAWRGSSNQRVLCLSSRYTPSDIETAWESQRKGYSIAVNTLGTMSISGFQDRETARSLEMLVRKKI